VTEKWSRATGCSLIALTAGILMTGCVPAQSKSTQSQPSTSSGSSQKSADSNQDSSQTSSGNTQSGGGIYVQLTSSDGGPGGDPDQPTQEPKDFSPGTTGGAPVMTNITWASWGGAQAYGYGQLTLNDCNPDCAGGTHHTYRAGINLTNVQNVNGKQEYTTYTINGPGVPPDAATGLTNQPTKQ
jgi:hypothetical protein